MVECTISTRVDGDVLKVFWSYCSEVGFIKVPCDNKSVTKDEVEDSNAEEMLFLIIKLNKEEQKPPRRGKTSRQAEDWSTVKHKTHMKHTTHERQRISTGLQTQGELYRETNEGNEGDTAGATETMIK